MMRCYMVRSSLPIGSIASVMLVFAVVIILSIESASSSFLVSHHDNHHQFIPHRSLRKPKGSRDTPKQGDVQSGTFVCCAVRKSLIENTTLMSNPARISTRGRTATSKYLLNSKRGGVCGMQLNCIPSSTPPVVIEGAKDDSNSNDAGAGESSGRRRTREGNSSRRRPNWRRDNPAMGDLGFLRKRTDSLLTSTYHLPATVNMDGSEHQSEDLVRRFKKDKKTFHFLMDAWAFSGEEDSVDQAVSLLNRMEELSQEVGSMTSHLIRPDVRSYTKVINAIARSAQPSSGEMAENILKKMEEKCLAGENWALRPNTHTYTAAAEAHANSGVPGSAQSAEEICNVMLLKFEGGDADVRPTARCFNAAISAYAKSAEEGAADRAQYLFDRMEETYKETGMEDVKPNRFNYNSLISAWANCVEVGSAHQAEFVLAKMEDQHQQMSLHGNTDDSCKPTTISYNSVIDAYAKSGEEGSEEKAEQLLRRMEQLYLSGENRDAKPNVRSFNSVINAWAKSGREDAAYKAEEILELMEKLFREGNTGVRPDVHSFCTVINAWARSQDSRKAERALNLFREMRNLYESGQNNNLRPNVVAVNAVMNACAYCTGDVHERSRAMEIAHIILKELEKSPYGNPDQVTYGTFLTACKNQMPDCSTREQIVHMLFRKCCNDGQVGSLVVQQLKGIVSEEVFKSLVGKGVYEDINMEDLPNEWWCNVVEGKWRRRRKLS